MSVSPTGRVILCGILNAVAVFLCIGWFLMEWTNSQLFNLFFIILSFPLLVFIEPLFVSWFVAPLIYGAESKTKARMVYGYLVGTLIVSGLMLPQVIGLLRL